MTHTRQELIDGLHHLGYEVVMLAGTAADRAKLAAAAAADPAFRPAARSRTRCWSRCFSTPER